MQVWVVYPFAVQVGAVITATYSCATLGITTVFSNCPQSVHLTSAKPSVVLVASLTVNVFKTTPTMFYEGFSYLVAYLLIVLSLALYLLCFYITISFGKV